MYRSRYVPIVGLLYNILHTVHIIFAALTDSFVFLIVEIIFIITWNDEIHTDRDRWRERESERFED